jgi:type I restriction enzyme S subunit
MTLKPYPIYKDSNVEWLGQVPEHWDIMPFKRVAQIQNGKDYKDIEVDEGGYPVLGSGGEFARASQFLYQKESVLLGRKGTIDQPIYINEPFWVVDTMFYSIISPRSCAKFVYYLSKTIRFDKYSTNTAVPSMTQEDLSSILFAVPVHDEQTAIATYLDRETARLDELIAHKTRFIELLKEKRSALITHTVTKGLNPNAPMKDSGVERLGQVPEHWEVKRLKFVAHLKSGETITANEIAEKGNYPVYGGNGLRGFSNTFTHNGYHVLIGRQGALCGNINYADGYFYASEHAVVVTTTCNTFWLGELLRIMNLGQYSVSTAQPGISVEVINELSIPAPPIQEQTAIATYLDQETARIDELVQLTEQSISLIKERRSALITSAVTGKIDVREQTQQKDFVT